MIVVATCHLAARRLAFRSSTGKATSLRLLQLVAQVITEKRPTEQVAIGALARMFETIGLSLVLNYWGVRTNPFD